MLKRKLHCYSYRQSHRVFPFRNKKFSRILISEKWTTFPPGPPPSRLPLRCRWPVHSTCCWTPWWRSDVFSCSSPPPSPASPPPPIGWSMFLWTHQRRSTSFSGTLRAWTASTAPSVGRTPARKVWLCRWPATPCSRPSGGRTHCTGCWRNGRRKCKIFALWNFSKFSVPHQNRSKQSRDAAGHLEKALLGALSSWAKNVRKQGVHGDVEHREGGADQQYVADIVDPHIHLAHALAPTGPILEW